MSVTLTVLAIVVAQQYLGIGGWIWVLFGVEAFIEILASIEHYLESR